MKTAKTTAIGACVALLALLSSGCDALTNRFKTCRDTPVDLVNSDQTRAAFFLLGPDERATSETLLQSGQSRRITLCLEKGDRENFRAIREGETQPVATATCVATLSTFEAARPRVLWTQVGFFCEGW